MPDWKSIVRSQKHMDVIVAKKKKKGNLIQLIKKTNSSLVFICCLGEVDNLVFVFITAYNSLLFVSSKRDKCKENWNHNNFMIQHTVLVNVLQQFFSVDTDDM